MKRLTREIVISKGGQHDEWCRMRSLFLCFSKNSLRSFVSAHLYGLRAVPESSAGPKHFGRLLTGTSSAEVTKCQRYHVDAQLIPLLITPPMNLFSERTSVDRIKYEQRGTSPNCALESRP